MRGQPAALHALVAALMDHGLIAQDEMQALLAAHGLRVATRPAVPGGDETLVLEPFAERLAQFQRRGATQ